VRGAASARLSDPFRYEDRIIDAITDPIGVLRAATADRHHALDTTLPLAGPDPHLADYRDHLRMLHAWLAPLECWLAGFDDGPQGEAAPPLVLRTPLIDADLALIGPAPAAAPAAPRWPASASAAYRWGVCYVVEGSQLGGAVLYQRLCRALAPHPLYYLHGDPDGAGPRWRRFTQALRASLSTPAEVAEACLGAREAFDRMLALRHG
jgi:heme oxygenase